MGLVVAYSAGGEAFVYPINIRNFHEMVNGTIGGIPLLATYCPQWFSGVVFSREVDDQTITFENTSALYQSDLVMYDHQTGSYWFQVGGGAGRRDYDRSEARTTAFSDDALGGMESALS